MRKEAQDFIGHDMRLVYVAKKLNEALLLEQRLTEAGLDYVVESDRYKSGGIFRSERVGAFFYVAAETTEAAHRMLRQSGYVPFEEQL